MSSRCLGTYLVDIWYHWFVFCWSLMPRSYCESLHVTCGPVPLSKPSGSRQLSQGNSSCWHPKRPPPCDWRPHQGPPRMNEKLMGQLGCLVESWSSKYKTQKAKWELISDKVHYHQNQLRQPSKKSGFFGWSLRFQHTSLKDIFQVGSEKIMRWLWAMIGTPSVPHLDTISMKFTYKGLEFHLGSFFHKKKSSQSTSIREKNMFKGKTIWNLK